MAGTAVIFKTIEARCCQLYGTLTNWNWHVLWCLLAALVMTAIAYGISLPAGSMGRVKVTDMQNHTSFYATLPYLVDTPTSTGSFEYQFNFNKDEIPTTRFHIVPDDCLRSLRINDRQVDLTIIPALKLCDYKHGFVIHLSSYLHAGRNTVDAVVEDMPVEGGKYGFSFSPHYPVAGSYTYWRIVFVCGLLLLSRWWFDRRLHTHPLFITLFMILVAVLVRLPFFFQSVSNESQFIYTGWDESTFINMGQHILEGHLPYVQLWDNKPPLLFYLFALLIKLSFGSLAGIRFWGAIIIGITGALCFALVDKIHNRRAAWYAGLLYILYSSANAWTYSVYSDHLCTPFMASAYLLFLADNRPYWLRSCFMGLLIGICAMIQSNYFALVPVFGLMQLSWFYPLSRYSLLPFVKNGLLVVLFSTLPFMGFWLMYVPEGYAELFWRSVVVAPLGLSQVNVFGNIFTLLATRFALGADNWMTRMGTPRLLPYALTLFSLFIWFTPSFRVVQRRKIILLIFLFGTALMTGMRGMKFELPVHGLGFTLAVSMVGGIMLEHLLTRRNVLAILTTMFCVVSALASAFPVYTEMFEKLANKTPLQSDADYRIAGTINQSPLPHPYIFTCETDQILYFLTHSHIPLLIAHAHIMTWDFLPDMAYNRTVSLDSMYEEIKSRSPAYIIAPEKHDCFAYFGEDYMKHYRKLYQIDNTQLWQRKQ